MFKPDNRHAQAFVPEQYYNLVMEARGHSPKDHPYSFVDIVHFNDRPRLFAVFNIQDLTVNGQSTSSVIITYKAVYSKHTITKVVY